MDVRMFYVSGNKILINYKRVGPVDQVYISKATTRINSAHPVGSLHVKDGEIISVENHDCFSQYEGFLETIPPVKNLIDRIL